jgi:NAD(P)-dependent dehydrogenase (short-subunit alcohol dehydrogenase family)
MSSLTDFQRGLGAVIAEKFAAEGCNISINWVSREAPAVELAEKLQKDFGVKTFTVQGVWKSLV